MADTREKALLGNKGTQKPTKIVGSPATIGPRYVSVHKEKTSLVKNKPVKKKSAKKIVVKPGKKQSKKTAKKTKPVDDSVSQA